MTDPRVALRAAHGRWLRVRANVRALRAKLVAAEHALARDARRAPGPEMAALQAQLAHERVAIEGLARDLDARIVAVDRACAALEPAVRATLVAAAKKRRTP